MDTYIEVHTNKAYLYCIFISRSSGAVSHLPKVTTAKP